MRTATALLLTLAAAGCAHGGRGATSNHPPSLRARCEPCAVVAGRTATLRVETQDADGDALTFAWHTPAGTLAAATARETQWTAPADEGPVPISVTVRDAKG